MKRFVANHPNVEAELKDLAHDLHEELEDIGERLHQTGKMLGNPKYKVELEAIGDKMHALDMKVKRNLKFDDEGLQMWKLHMDNDKFKEVHAER